MEFWDNIVHAALLGTDKRQVRKEDLAGDLVKVYEEVTTKGDKEEQYLNMAAVASNYRKSGYVPYNKTVVRTSAENEVKTYCNHTAHQVLQDIVLLESHALINLWLEECNCKNQIVLPEFIPLLFDLAVKYRALQPQVLTVTGKRGAWLLTFNEAWRFEISASDESVWQTGTLEQRKNYLKELRETDPAKGRYLLQQAWAQENANTKAELLKQLSVSINEEDVKWLELLMDEKSQKVKDEALRLLKLLPGSSIVQKYFDITKQSIQVRKEKGLLGIGSKLVLDIKLPDEIEESIFKTGIEKISSQKGESESGFIMYQLIAAVPPFLLTEYYKLTPKEFIDLFNKSREFKALIPAFGLAAGTFKDVDCLKVVIAVSNNQLYAEALQLLPEDEKENYALQFFGNEQAAEGVIHYLLLYYKRRWSLKLAMEIFKHTAKNNYKYNRAFYKEHIIFFPTDIIPMLAKLAPTGEYERSVWIKTSEYITHLLTLRIQIQKAFQP